MREKPLRPWIIADSTGIILGAHCTCMAGLGEACTHVASLLFSVDSTVRIRDSKTVTEEKAYWLLPSAMKSVQYKEVRDIDFTSASTAKRKFNSVLDAATNTTITGKPPIPKSPGCNPKPDRTPEATDAEMDIFFGKLSASGCKPVILSLVEPYYEDFIPKVDSEDFPQNLTELREDKCFELNYKELCDYCEHLEIVCSAQQSAAVELATRDQSQCKLWNVFRAGRITASKTKAVCCTNQASPAQSLIKAICYPDTMKFVAKTTKWGCEHEKVARDEFVLRMTTVHDNCRVDDSGFYISTDVPYIGASPDGIFTCDCCGQATVEIKCPYCIRSESVEKCDYLENVDGICRLKRNHDYYFQVQTQLACAKLEKSYFVVWTEKELHIEEIFFDSELWTHISAVSKHIFYSAILPELVGKFFSRLPSLYNKRTLVALDLNSTDTNKTSNSAGEQLFCYCGQVEHGDMIACDNHQCEIEWFHYVCVNIENPPRGKWYCPDCRKLPVFKRKRLR